LPQLGCGRDANALVLVLVFVFAFAFAFAFAFVFVFAFVFAFSSWERDAVRLPTVPVAGVYKGDAGTPGRRRNPCNNLILRMLPENFAGLSGILLHPGAIISEPDARVAKTCTFLPP
jgi:hypothetical protein